MVEDFTEFDQGAAYFDRDHVIAAKKDVNVPERGSQVHFKKADAQNATRVHISSTTPCTICMLSVLPAAFGEQHDNGSRRADQNVYAAWHQGHAAIYA